MQLNRIMTAAAGGTLAVFAQTALALPPTTIPDITIKVAGSTIQDNNIVALLGQICKSGSLDNYKDSDASGKGTYYRAFFCTIDSSKVPGLTLKDPAVLILKRNKSGVVTGVYPLLEPSKPIPLMGINNTVAVGGANQPQCTAGTTANSWTCRTDRAGDLFNATPDLAVADVDPQLMRGVNYASTIDGISFNQPTSAAVAANLTVVNAGAVVQNTPVTLDLRNALQLAQIEQGVLPADCHAGDETERCMPSLGRGLIASLFAGRIGKWSDIKVESPLGATPLTHYNGGPAGDELVRLCRRNRGASTQASFNAYFLNIPCSSSGVAPVEVSNPLAGPIVATPTQVTTTEDCLADFNDGTNNSQTNPLPGTKGWAIGMLTTERNTNLAKNYRYIKIDGYAPTIQQAAAGHYLYFSEAAYLWRKTDPQPSGDQLVIIQKIAKDATSPTIFGKLNAAIGHRWGTGAYLAVSPQGYPVVHPFDPANPVTPYTHAPAGLNLDNCRIPQVDDGANGRQPNL